MTVALPKKALRISHPTMPKAKSQKSTRKKGDNKSNNCKQGRPPKRVTEIVFDAQARENYLKGFSERKKQRRVYGLAMQKLKDRKSKLEQRAEMKKAVEDQILEAERQKSVLFGGECPTELGNASISTNASKLDSTSELDPLPSETSIAVYEDEEAQSQWGGQVIVTTKTDFSDEDDDVESNKSRKRNHAIMKSNDEEQEYSGKVERYIRELKGKMPSKKTKTRQLNQPKMQRGKHGAAAMQGIGGDGNFKIAKKMLSRTQASATLHPQMKKKNGKRQRK